MPRTKKVDILPPEEKAETTDNVEAAETDTRYSAASLRRNAMHLFRVNPEIVDGALYGAEGKDYSITEAQSLITAYLQREVY